MGDTLMLDTKLLTIIALVLIGLFIATAAFAQTCQSYTWCDKYGCHTTTNCY